MAAPEYLIKLRFGTEVDKKAFNELQNTYNNLNKKQQAAFAKNYNSTLEDMNKLFHKTNMDGLKQYEKAVAKTESNITATRVKELRNYITKRNQQLARLPGYTGGALLAGGTAIAHAAIANNYDMTSFEKNTLMKGGGGLISGAVSGAMVAGPVGALVGAAVGTTSMLIAAHFENSTKAIEKSAQLFNNAVTTYKSYLDKTIGLQGGMYAAGFEDMGQYWVYQQALKNLDIDSDAFVDMVARNLMGNKKTEGIGMAMVSGNRAEALQTVYDMWQKSGMSAREYALTSVDKGGLGLSRNTAAQVIAMLEGGGIQQAIYKVLGYTNLRPGENASEFTARLESAREKRIDLSNRDWASDIENFASIMNIDLNKDIIQEGNEAFARNLELMKESTILLSGINVAYRTYEKELREIFSYITEKSGTGTTYARGAQQALQQGGFEGLVDYVNANRNGGMSLAKPMMSKIKDAEQMTHWNRSEVRPQPINEF